MKFVFVNGRVAIIVRYWEQRTDRVVDDGTVDGGARVELRRVEQLTGPGHRAGNGGFSVLPVSDGLWRADLFMILTEPGTPGFHYHPNFENNDVGDRFDDDLIRVDPVRWVSEQLADIATLLQKLGAGELVSSMDLDEHRRAMPLIITAVEACMARLPIALSAGREPRL
jgi:hypothetical protein